MDSQPENDSHAALRRSIYGILICIGLGAMIGRILAVDSVDFRRVADISSRANWPKSAANSSTRA